MTKQDKRRAWMIFLLILLALWVNPDRPGAQSVNYRYDAVVKCKTQLQEDQAAHVKLVRYEHTEDGLKLVYKCQNNY